LIRTILNNENISDRSYNRLLTTYSFTVPALKDIPLTFSLYLNDSHYNQEEIKQLRIFINPR